MPRKAKTNPAVLAHKIADHNHAAIELTKCLLPGADISTILFQSKVFMKLSIDDINYTLENYNKMREASRV